MFLRIVTQSVRYGSRALLLLGVLIGLTGCFQTPKSGRVNSRLEHPKAGTARILSTKIEQTADRTRWRWDIFGDRNWTKPNADGSGRIALEDAYPINAVPERTGCFTWFVELTVYTDTEKAHWEVLVHGTNGTTARAEGDSVKKLTILEGNDSTPALPADLHLATVGTTEIRLRLPER